MKENTKTALRHEASHLLDGCLTASQSEAMNELSSFIGNAVETSDCQENDRFSRLCLLSGDRGNGKTSLILTLKKCFNNYNSKHSTDSYNESWAKQVEKIADNVVWLETLSLDPMPKGTNLMAAILARIASATGEEFASYSQQRGGLFDSASNLDRAKNTLMTLRTDAIMGLEGNLDIRASGLDPETYAALVADSEVNKTKISKKLNDTLTAIARGIGEIDNPKKVYVLTIDDVDIHPSKAIEILKLAYGLSIPRLFFIFLGSDSVLDQALFYRTQCEFSDLFGNGSRNRQGVMDAIESVSNEISSSLLRKLIPPGQRIQVGRMQIPEGLAYRPDNHHGFGGSNSPIFARVLNNIKWSPEEITTWPSCDKASYPLSALFGAWASQENALEYYGSYYEGANLLAGSPRQVSDLYHLFYEFYLKCDGTDGLTMNSSQYNDLFSELQKNLITLIDEDAALGVTQQDVLRKSVTLESVTSDSTSNKISLVEGDDNGNAKTKKNGNSNQNKTIWHMDTSQIELIHSTQDELNFRLKEGDTSDHIQSKVVVRGIRKHHLFVKSTGENKNYRMSMQTRAGFKLLHDLMLISDEGRISRFIDYKKCDEIACTEWDDGSSEKMRIPWMTACWGSFWHLDRFSAYWNLGMNEIRQAHTHKSPELKDEEFSIILLFNWIGAVVSALLAKPNEEISLKYSTLKEENPTNIKSLKWEFCSSGVDLLVNIDDLSKHVENKHNNGEDDQEADLIDALLVELACLAMPEIGIMNICATSTEPDSLPRKAIKELLGGILELSYLKKIDYRIRAKRLMRIGPHIGTELGYKFLSSSVATSTPDPFSLAGDELKAHFLKWERKGFGNKICKHSIEFVREKLLSVVPNNNSD